jgi:hypothetical protein
MSYAGVESESEYAQKKYDLVERHAHEHCGSTATHGTHWTRHQTAVCTGNILPTTTSPLYGKHKGEYHGD